MSVKRQHADESSVAAIETGPGERRHQRSDCGLGGCSGNSSATVRNGYWAGAWARVWPAGVMLNQGGQGQGCGIQEKLLIALLR